MFEQEYEDGLLLKALVGSQARGLAVEDSDEDWRGFSLLPDEAYWSIDPEPPDRIQPDSVIYGDQVYYEVRKFVRLLYDASPEHLEVLWSDTQVIPSHYGMMLREIRHKLVSKAVVKRLLDAAGRQSVQSVYAFKTDCISPNDVWDKTQVKTYLGDAGMLCNALRHSNPVEARKMAADSYRRLFVAREMLDGAQSFEQVVPEFDWQHLTDSFNETGDSVFVVRLPRNVANMLIDFRNGKMTWDYFLKERNTLFLATEMSSNYSKLRDKADTAWGNHYLNVLRKYNHGT